MSAPVTIIYFLSNIDILRIILCQVGGGYVFGFEGVHQDGGGRMYSLLGGVALYGGG